MRITAPAIAVLTIGLAVAGVWYFGPAPDPSGAPELAESRAPQRGETESAGSPVDPAASDTAAEARDAAAETVETPNDAAARRDAAPPPSEPAVMPMAELLEARAEQVPPELVRGEREFAAEPVDTSWAPSAEARILDAFAQMPGLALISLDVECRSTMCRLQAASPASQDGAIRSFNILVDSIGLETRWQMAVIDPSGALQSVAYVRRDNIAP